MKYNNTSGSNHCNFYEIWYGDIHDIHAGGVITNKS